MGATLNVTRAASAQTASTAAVTSTAAGTSTGAGPYPVMTLSAAEIQQEISDYNNAPKAQLTVGTLSYPPSFSLLGDLTYDPAARNQGNCGNCWVWGGTGVLENAFDVQFGVKVRLSEQFFDSCWPGNGPNDPYACCGGWETLFASWYNSVGYAIPRSNTNGYFQDEGVNPECSPSALACCSVSNFPAYSFPSCTDVAITTHGVGTATAINNIENVLNQNKMVAWTFFLPSWATWDDFFSFWGSGLSTQVWDPTSDWTQGSDSGYGGHTVDLVGYDATDPSNPYWICLNSWGTTANRPDDLFRVSMNMNYDPQYICQFETLNVTYNPLPITTITLVQPRHSAMGGTIRK